ncbi:Hsp20/alpha crystallin family protein [Neisseriaceae bacterium JH1-16]|nr:Hsp20/alpha crystallin family protein [Neisseriaceae bacterium JH1-16]
MGNQTEVQGKIPAIDYDPFKIYENIGKMFGGMLSQDPWRLPGSWWLSSMASPNSITIDISENDIGYRIVADMPGVKKEDIKVTVEGNTVTIAAEFKDEKKGKNGEEVVHTERRYGEVFRRLSLDKNIDEGKVKASYSDGVLELMLPKRDISQSKKIVVQ